MPDLPKRLLGRTGLHVTTLGFGALELRGMVAGVGRPLKSGQPERILHAVLSLPTCIPRPDAVSRRHDSNRNAAQDTGINLLRQRNAWLQEHALPEAKTLVTVGGDLVAFLPVGRRAAGVE